MTAFRWFSVLAVLGLTAGVAAAQSADQHGAAPQRGPGELLDGREERVHVEVQHPTRVHNCRCYCASV